MKYFQKGKWWLPDGDEQHLREWMTNVKQRKGKAPDRRLTYQWKKYDAARAWTTGRRTAVDVGAHVGLWSWMMAQDFHFVRAFEPALEHVQCWHRNMERYPNAKVSQCALGEAEGYAFLSRRNVSMKASIDTEGEKVRMKTLDAFGIKRMDLLKIDCEGYELFVLKGGVETIDRCRPCIIVEQKPDTEMDARYGTHAGEAVDFLTDMGAKLRREIRGDYILSWED